MWRGRIVLGSFALVAVLLLMFPSVDLAVAGYFFDGKSFLRDQWWQVFLHEALGYYLGACLIGISALYVINRIFKRRICNVCGRRVLYAFLVLIVGAGLIVNVALKDNFGRARPRDVAEFGGTKQFTPAFVVSHECKTNCSFSSGDAAGGFFSIAMALALTRRRVFLAAAVALGALIALARISSGAHFFSDTVVSFFVMLITADVLYVYLLVPRAEREKSTRGSSALEPA